MSLIDLASIGSFISGIAVLISLIVLMLQMRQSSHNQRATIHFQRLAIVQDALLSSFVDPAANSIFMRGSAGDTTLNSEEITKYLTVTRNTFRLFEEFFYQHRDGMLDQSRWANSVRRFRGFAASPGFRAAWQFEQKSCEPDFVAWVDGVMASVPIETKPADIVSVWHDLILAQMNSSGQT